MRPVLQGAGQERGLRPGTENVAQIVGLGKAAELAAQSLDSHQKQMAKHRERLWTGLRSAVGDRLTRNGDPDRSLPNTLSVNFPDVVGVQLLEQACEVFASTGAACHSGRTHRSATLAAIHLPPEIARGTVRLSVGWPTTDEQVDRAVDALASAWEVLRWRSDDPS